MSMLKKEEETGSRQENQIFCKLERDQALAANIGNFYSCDFSDLPDIVLESKYVLLLI